MADSSGQLDLRRILATSRLGELDLDSGRTLAPESTVAEAAAVMREHSHGSALVCDADGRVVGIFTERDLMRVIGEGRSLETPLSEVMTSQPRTVTCEDSLLEAIRLMDQGGYRRLPVVDADGRAVGVADVKVVVHFLVEHFPTTIYNQASREQLLARNREGA